MAFIMDWLNFSKIFVEKYLESVILRLQAVKIGKDLMAFAILNLNFKWKRL